jgi:hypothetical protein
VDEAAEKFASAIKESYQALADRSVSAQELNAQLTQNCLRCPGGLLPVGRGLALRRLFPARRTPAHVAPALVS